jgi:hypothetical protein
LRVKATDSQGNQSAYSANGSVIIDTTSPAAHGFTVTYPKNRTIVAYARPLMKFHTTSDATSGVQSYRIILTKLDASWQKVGQDTVWIGSIPATAPASGVYQDNFVHAEYVGVYIRFYSRKNTLKLTDGNYRWRVQASDALGHTTDTASAEFTVTLNSLDTQVTNKTETTAPTPTASPNASGTAKPKPTVVTYPLTIKVVDTNKKPVVGATVTLHSTPQTTKTDSNGVATFANVAQGQHRVEIAYGGQKGEQVIDVTPSNANETVSKFDFTIQIKSTNPLTTAPALTVFAILALVIMALCVAVVVLARRNRKNVPAAY